MIPAHLLALEALIDSGLLAPREDPLRVPQPSDPTHAFVLSFYQNIRDFAGEILCMTPGELNETLTSKLDAIRGECDSLQQRIAREEADLDTAAVANERGR